MYICGLFTDNYGDSWAAGYELTVDLAEASIVGTFLDTLKVFATWHLCIIKIAFGGLNLQILNAKRAIAFISCDNHKVSLLQCDLC